MKTVLFVAEGVALAHVTRTLGLAQALDPHHYEVHIASDPRYARLLNLPETIRFWPLVSHAGDSFTARADRAAFVWQESVLDAYIKDEVALYDRVKPSLVVSDFRFSIGVSAELARVHHAAVTNAHWSPYRRLPFPSSPPWPALTLLRQRLQRLSWRRPKGATMIMNDVRRRHGLAPLTDFLDMSTHGDWTFYADPEGLIPVDAERPASHVFLGPLLWSPTLPYPAWWRQWKPGRPLIYVTLGSTGAAAHLPGLLRALSSLPVTIVVATAGRIDTRDLPECVLASEFLPGQEVCGMASLVICSGGSATAYQALSQGAPVLGLWSNLDQYLTMMSIAAAGAGVCRHASDAARVRGVVERMLADESWRRAAARLRDLCNEHDAPARFVAAIEGPPSA